jgi:hypothetical protein
MAKKPKTGNRLNAQEPALGIFGFGHFLGLQKIALDYFPR